MLRQYYSSSSRFNHHGCNPGASLILDDGAGLYLAPSCDFVSSHISFCNEFVYLSSFPSRGLISIVVYC